MKCSPSLAKLEVASAAVLSMAASQTSYSGVRPQRSAYWQRLPYRQGGAGQESHPLS